MFLKKFFFREVTSLAESLNEFYVFCRELNSPYLQKLTPYLHTVVYHLPVILDIHPNINMFNLQGKSR